MFTKTAIALAIILATATNGLAATKRSGTNPAFDVYDTRGKYIGSDPDIHVRGALQRDSGWPS
jgi:hypothetical protein